MARSKVGKALANRWKTGVLDTPETASKRIKKAAITMRGRKRSGETKAITKGSTELHNENRHMWGSRQAIGDFTRKYGGPRKSR